MFDVIAQYFRGLWVLISSLGVILGVLMLFSGPLFLAGSVWKGGTKPKGGESKNHNSNTTYDGWEDDSYWKER